MMTKLRPLFQWLLGKPADLGDPVAAALNRFRNPDADTLARKFSLPLVYDQKAEQASWRETMKFLREIFTIPGGH